MLRLKRLKSTIHTTSESDLISRLDKWTKEENRRLITAIHLYRDDWDQVWLLCISSPDVTDALDRLLCHASHGRGMLAAFLSPPSPRGVC